MNRKQKIIISVTGIFLVLLILVGLTYAYFLTQITGNTNEKSISVTTADLKLVYDDGSGVLTSTNKLVPNTVVSSKTFSVENRGDTTIDSYAVILEDLKITYASTIGTVTQGEITYLNRPEDFVLTITCTSSNATKRCGGYDDVMPSTNDILLINSIEEGEKHSYTLTLTYKEAGVDQSKDMNKLIEGKLNIIDTNGTVDIEGTVANYNKGDYVQVNSEPIVSYINKDGKYKLVGLKPDDHTVGIYNNGTASSTKDITILKGTTSGVNNSNITITDRSRTASIDIDAKSKSYTINETVEDLFIEDTIGYALMNDTRITKNLGTPTFTGAETKNVGMYSAEDDYGISWYFRGAQSYNYVNFAGFTWRIVRINGDGSIRLILDGTLDKVKREGETTVTSTISNYNCANINNACVGYMYGYHYKKNDTTTFPAFEQDTGCLKIVNDDYQFLYADKETCVNSGGEYMTSYSITHKNVNDSIMKKEIDKFYENYIENNEKNYHYGSYLSDTLFCADKSLASDGIGDVSTQLGWGENLTHYAASERLWFESGSDLIQTAKPTLECAKGESNTYSRYTSNSNVTTKGVSVNSDLDYPIALLSADELVMAGAFRKAVNTKYYLEDAYNQNKGLARFWTMTPRGFTDIELAVYIFVGLGGGGNSLNNATATTDKEVGTRPVINLKADNLISGGNGTYETPYTLKEIN